MSECGDGVHDPLTEECDEGANNSEHSACTGECLFNVCGDGNRHDGVEECDLGDANHDSACGGCTKSCTFGPYCGDNNTDAPRFRAWISAVGLDEYGVPLALVEEHKTVEGRLNSDYTGSYVTRDGTVVAEGWSGLTSGQLLAPITATTEPDQHMYDASVWTNTRPDGFINQSYLSCQDWTSAEGGFGGGVGDSGSVTSWTFIASNQGVKSCQFTRHLYCIEQ